MLNHAETIASVEKHIQSIRRDMQRDAKNGDLSYFSHHVGELMRAESELGTLRAMSLDEVSAFNQSA